MKEFSFINLSLFGVAAVGGLMSGTCLAIKKTLTNGQARKALFLGYAFIGVTFAAIGVAIEPFLPVLTVKTVEGAFLIGLTFGAAGVLVVAATNLGSIITLRYLGLKVTIEPEHAEHDRRRDDK